MRPWRGGRRPGRGIAFLHARPRHSGKRSTRAAAAGLPGRRCGGNCGHRPARAGADRAADGPERHRMTAQTKIAVGFDAEKAREDFPILARDVYGKRLVYLDSGASAQKPAVVLDAMRHFATTEY